MLRQLTDLNLISSLLAVRKISPLEFLKAVLYPPAEAHGEPSQASQVEVFARIVNVFKLTLLFFLKRFHRRYLQGPIIPLFVLLRN